MAYNDPFRNRPKPRLRFFDHLVSARRSVSMANQDLDCRFCFYGRSYRSHDQSQLMPRVTRSSASGPGLPKVW